MCDQQSQRYGGAGSVDVRTRAEPQLVSRRVLKATSGGERPRRWRGGERPVGCDLRTQLVPSLRDAAHSPDVVADSPCEN
jgi:hypothetical protein